MTPHPRLSRAGLELVKGFEGLRRKAARLKDGGWTIGYGHTVSAREGAEVSAEEAEALLLYDLDKVARAIEPLIFTPLDRNQFNALVAFAFNVGIEGFRASAVLKRVNEGALLQAAAALELWRRADFEGDSLVVDALVRRRAAEKALFLTPPEGFHPVPTPMVRPACDSGAAELQAQAQGLAGAAALHVSLDSEAAVALADAEAGEEEAGEIEDAARKLAERLRSLFPDAEPPPPPKPEPEAEPEPKAAPVLEEEPEPPPPPVEPEAEPEPPPPPIAEAAAAPQRLFEPESPKAEPLDAGPIARPLSTRGGAPERARRKAREAAERRARLVLLAGLLGALMFAGGLAAMLLGRATLLNLVVGLVGVVLMVPAGLRLLGRAFGDRAQQD